MIPADLLRLFSQTVTIYRSAGENSRGDRQYSTTPQTYKARQEGKLMFVRDLKGNDVLIRTRTFVAATSTGHANVALDDKVIFPDGTTPKLVTVDRLDDENGPNHEVLYT